MAIKYFVGNRMSALSTDTKPTGFLNGAILSEIDTGRTYVLSGNAWASMHPSYVERVIVPDAGYASGLLVGVPNGRVYSTGVNELEVYINGWRQNPDTNLVSWDNDFQEFATTGVKIHYALASGSLVLFQVNY